ncbi:hypothetical protein ACOSQ2_019127 [Xanthoceras sorbifolium]
MKDNFLDGGSVQINRIREELIILRLHKSSQVLKACKNRIPLHNAMLYCFMLEYCVKISPEKQVLGQSIFEHYSCSTSMKEPVLLHIKKRALSWNLQA